MEKKGFNRFCFGVMSSTMGSQATPLWVFKSGVPGVDHMNGTQTDPVYWHAAYLKKVKHFVKAMGIALSERRDVEFIDMRNIGVWGEMHFSLNRKGMWTHDELVKNGFSGKDYFEAYKSMILFYKEAFPMTALFLNIAPGKEAIVKYAVKNRINLRFDGLAITKNKNMGLVSDYFNYYGYDHKQDGNNKNHETMTSNLPNLILSQGGSNSLSGWRPAKGISIIFNKNFKEVKVTGIQKGKWSYALIHLPGRILIPGNKYRLEAMVKVDTLSNESYVPYLKLQAHDQNDRFVKNYITHKYDTIAMQTWQRLWSEFEIGPTERSGFIAIEKGTTKEIGASIQIKSIRLVDISEIDFEISKNKLSVGEPNGFRCCYEFASGINDLWTLKQVLAKAVADPVSYIHLNYFNEKKTPTFQEIKLIEDVANKIGYRFKLNRVSCAAISNNDSEKKVFLIKHSWENKGTAPCYKKLLLQFLITDKNRNVVSKFSGTSEASQWKLDPKMKIDLTSKLPISCDLRKGVSYSLNIKLIDLISLENIKLPLQTYDGNHYKLFDFHYSKDGIFVFHSAQKSTRVISQNDYFIPGAPGALMTITKQ